MARRKGKGGRSRSRRFSLRAGVGLAALLVAWGSVGDWFVHHPRDWHRQVSETWPAFITGPLYLFGNPVADLTDGLGLTGHDAVYEYDEGAPRGSVFFAGAPRRTGAPAPADLRILDRGEFKIGWSDSLRHPVWCAYHVPKSVRWPETGKRPGFRPDKTVPAAPLPGDYTGSNYDRGHMAPNHAMLTRFGEDVRRNSFLMSNIAPQSAALNRGVWKNVEHRIADLWTARYGEIWVIVGALPSKTGEKLLGSTNIDVPSAYYQVIIAQDGLDVRALAVLFPQSVPWEAWAARHIVSIDELEELTGLDFNPDLPEFIQTPLEAELPTRLWPVRPVDILRQFLLRYR